MRQSNTDLQHELEERLRFETLLVEISASFVNLPVGQIDGAIVDAQRRICELLYLDRSVLWQACGRVPEKMLLTHVHQPPEGLLPENPFHAMDNFPWLLTQVLKGETVAIPSLDDFPPEAIRDRESFQLWGTKSTLVVPLSIGGQIVGAVSFGHLRKERDWPERVVKRLQLLAQVFANALARKEAEDSLQGRQRFESLLVDISARFVNLPAERIDSEIEDAQRRVCECLGLDLSALWQWSSVNTPHFLSLTHLHSPPEGPSRPEEPIDAQEVFPWQFKKMLCGETLAFSTEGMPPEAARDQEARRNYGIKSSVVIPLSTGGGPLIGVLTFDTLQEERDWPDPLVKRLTLVAQVFANALERKHSEETLRKTEARLSLAADSAEAGFWELDCSTNLFWATERARINFGYDPEEVISMERFEASIHPDDLELVRQAIGGALSEREPVDVEYRILVGDGRLKWISSRGRPYFKPTGEPDRLMGVSIDISERKQMENELNERLQEIEKLKGRLENENLYLRKELRREQGFDKIVGDSKAHKIRHVCG